MSLLCHVSVLWKIPTENMRSHRHPKRCWCMKQIHYFVLFSTIWIKWNPFFFFKDCRSTSTNDYLKGKKYEKVIFLLFSFPFFFSFLFYLNFLFIIWYQIHFKSILTSVWWTYQVTCYRTVIESPIIYCPSHEL